MRTSGWTRATLLLLVLPVAGTLSAGQWEREASDAEGLPSVYVADFVATAASGAAMNDRGDVATAVNDAGDQARFLVSISGENLVYLFRFHHEGTWQILSFAGTGHLSTYGIGSINAAKDVWATVQTVAVIATGPDGMAEPLQSFLSPAYGGASIGSGGPMNGSTRDPAAREPWPSWWTPPSRGHASSTGRPASSRASSSRSSARRSHR